MNSRRARHIRAKKIRAALITGAALVVLACAVIFWVRGVRPIFSDAQATPQSTAGAEDTLAPSVSPKDIEATKVAFTAKPTSAKATETSETVGTAAPTTKPTLVPTAIPPQPTPKPLPLDGLTIGIDPGHQTHADSSTEPVAPGSATMKAKVSTGTQGVSTRVPEYVVNLQVGLLLRDRLEAQGAKVVMTREENDVSISNKERAELCNDAGADLILRLHCNGATDGSVNGISLFVRATGENAEEALAAANILLPAMLETTGANNYGVYKRDTYTGLNWSVPPCILVEMGFMSNAAEDEKLCDPDYQELLAEGMVRGVAEDCGRSLEAPVQAEPNAEPTVPYQE